VGGSITLDVALKVLIVKSARPEQLAPVNEVTGWKLDANAMQEIDQILAETIKDEVGPEFMAPPSARAHQTNGESSRSPS
jgi:diketogulonate reductase-like aldo/keto reductase